MVMSDLPAEEVELIEDPDEVHKIYRQSFIDEQVHIHFQKDESHFGEIQNFRISSNWTLSLERRI